MQELLHAVIQLVNLPWTVMLGLVLLYWLLMIIGLFDVDSIDSHLGLHHDVHVGGEVDLGHGHNIDAHAHAPGLIQSLCNFLNLGDVPVMIVGSVLTVCGWAFSVIANYYFNPDYSAIRGLFLLIPNLLVCLLVTHFLTLPLRALFKKLNEDQDAKVELIGRVAQVSSGEANSTFGQATIDHKGVPITLNVRTPEDLVFSKGESVLIIEEDKANRTFNVIKYEEPN